MPGNNKTGFPHPGTPQGFALIALLAILATGMLYFLVGQLDAGAAQRRRDEITTRSLVQAKEALIAWSVNRADVSGARPGELPCPDTDAPGAVGYGIEEGSCAAGKVGRLPWKTLGIEELVDGYGEPLWYAIDGSFRRSTSIINSDNRASQLVYAQDGTTKITMDGSEAAAVVFAPGRPLGEQNRGTVAQQKDPANYLDSGLGFTNASGGGPYIQGIVKNSSGNVLVNDRLIVISSGELISAVETRVLRTVGKMLDAYFAANGGSYPYPARFNDPACLDASITSYCNSDKSICRGRIPQVASLTTPALNDWPEDPTSPGNPVMPLWFSANLWGQLLYYSADSSVLKPASPPVSCAPKISGGSVKVVVLFPGSALGLVNRNSGGMESTNLADYFEDPENQDGWSPGGNDNYVSPGTSGVVSNDHILTIK